MDAMAMNSSLDFQLLNDFQRDFPLCPAPFAELASRLGVGEKVVLGRLENLRREGKISRVGAVFAPKRIGASTLAAMAVPPEKLEAVAATVNRFPEVNHNYEREHRYNLWFVVTAASEGRLQASLGAIEQAAGYPLLTLPLLEEFHIDLGFCLNGGKQKCVATAQPVQPVALMDEAERRLVSVLQEGLPLFIRPFALIAERIGASEIDVLGRASASSSVITNSATGPTPCWSMTSPTSGSATSAAPSPRSRPSRCATAAHAACPTGRTTCSA
jgi:DNA-binding Lrp family transcriptional regulator